MKRLKYLAAILALAVCASSCTTPKGTAQDEALRNEQKALEKERKKQEKERKKQQEARVERYAHDKAVEAILNFEFVLRAQSVSYSGGYMASGINPDMNFILIQGDAGAIQTATSFRYPGPNGLGGFTSSGRVSDMTVNEAKNGDMIVDFSVIGRTANAHVSITLFKDSDQASAIVSHNLAGGNITMRGQLIPYRNKDLKIEK